MRALIFSFLSLYALTQAQAQVSLGTFTPFVAQYQNDESGGTNQFAFNPMLTGFFDFNLNQMLLKLEVGLIHFAVESSDEYSKYGFFWLLDWKQPLRDDFALRLGIGNFATIISGDGGTKQQNDGSSSRAFYKPNTSEVASNFSLNAGAEMKFNEEFGARAQIFLLSPISEDRSIAHMISINYIGGF